MNSSGIGKNTYLPTCLSCSCKLELLLQFHLCSLLIAKFYFATRKRMRLLFAQVKMQVKYKKHFLSNEPLANVGSWCCQSCTHHCEPPTIFVCFHKGIKPKLVTYDMFSFKTIVHTASCIRGGQCVTLSWLWGWGGSMYLNLPLQEKRLSVSQFWSLILQKK